MASGLFRQGPNGGEAEVATRDEKGAAERTVERPKPYPGAPARTERPGGPSVVGPGTEITGEVEVRGDLRVEGRIEGDVSTKGEVVVSDRGSLKGTVEADAVVVEGRIEGKVRARQVARFKAGCRVTADVESPAVELEEGGRFEGRIDMGGSPDSPGGAADSPGGAGRKEAGS